MAAQYKIGKNVLANLDTVNSGDDPVIYIEKGESFPPFPKCNRAHIR